MDAITLLETQHREVESLFEQYAEAKSAAKKKAIFEQLADDLAVHTTIEEKIFYPAAYASETDDLLEEAVQEHLSIKRLLVDLMELTPGDPAFDAKITVMKEQVEHHVEEEEGELFPKVREKLDRVNLEALGGRMQSLFTREMQAGASRNIADQVDEAPSFT
jgi:hemerythrin superfamily protein